jgi:CheY-like chemotaxis protein
VRVLCVDDNPDIADSLAEILTLCGYFALARYDGPSALAAVAAGFRPDVCFLDLHMPGMDGDELAARLRDRLADAPPVLIAVTAQEDADAARQIQRAGFHARFVKPADPTRLLAVLAHLDD